MGHQVKQRPTARNRQMTRKQEALYELNLLRAALNLPTVTPKKAEKMAYGVVLTNIELAKKELAA
jgi:recombinational DNA repair protein RecR